MGKMTKMPLGRTTYDNSRSIHAPNDLLLLIRPIPKDKKICPRVQFD